MCGVVGDLRHTVRGRVQRIVPQDRPGLAVRELLADVPALLSLSAVFFDCLFKQHCFPDILMFFLSFYRFF